jgi:uncharacterized protein
MSVPTTYPGVYIREFTPGAPIQPVGTSTAAMLGPCQAGPPNQATRVTSWDQFKRVFGELPVANHYLWYAARGYFENGGTTCYITRVSNASYDELVLADRTTDPGQPVIRVRARELGPSAPPISVAVTDDDAITGGQVFRHTAAASGASQTTITISDPDKAAAFRPGDSLTWAGIAAGDSPVVARVDGGSVRLAGPLSQSYQNITVRLADLPASATSFRMTTPGAVPAAGQLLRLTQAEPPDEPPADQTTADVTVAAVIVERISPALTTYRITTRDPVGADFPATADTSVRSFEFRITVSRAGQPDLPYPQLGIDPQHPRYYASLINASAAPITAYPVEPPNLATGVSKLPRVLAATALAGGTADNPTSLQASDYAAAIDALAQVRDVNQVLVPDRTDLQVQLAVVDHCARGQDRFAVLDSRRGAEPFGDTGVQGQLAGLRESKGYGALYYPWLLVAPALGSDPVLVPPSGHVAGIFARTDSRRGVHKAPAGNEATVSGALGTELTMTDIDQGVLNMDGVNVIRVFSPGARPVVWGARTTATTIDSNWQYVNIRRLFIFLERSLQEGLRWVVFEPNNQALWMKVKRTATDFLTRAWRDGAMFGGTPEEAFYVRIDEALNPFSDQALGRLNIEIGIRPSYPAEFVIVNIGIWPGGSEVSEG